MDQVRLLDELSATAGGRPEGRPLRLGHPGSPAEGRIGAAAFETLGLGASWLTLAVASPLAGLASRWAHWLLLAIVLIDVPLQLDVNVLHVMEAEEFGGLGGFSLSVTTAMLGVLYARWALLLALAPHRSASQPGPAVSRALCAYVAVSVVSTALAADVSYALRELFLLLQLFLLYVYVLFWVRTDRDVQFLLLTVLAGLAVESLLVAYGSAVGETMSLGGLKIHVDEGLGGDVRVGGTFGSPNAAASYLALLLAPALAVQLTTLPRTFKLLAAAAAGLAALALIPTQSRGGWMATVLSVGLLWLVTARGRRALVLPAVGAVVVVPVLLFSGSTITERLSGDDNGSAQGRLPLIETAFELIRDHPVVGVGPNNYTLVMREYGAVYGDWGDWVYVVHNKFLLVWAETGTLGLMAFIAFLAAAIRHGWRAWKAGHPWLSPLALGFTCGIVGQLLHMQVDIFNGRAQVQMLWIVAALLAVLATRTRAAIDGAAPAHAAPVPLNG
jgi:putative inorganic carbon (HCO3(-)) transporter